MLPPAPVLLSMMMGWPHLSCSFSAATRASTSLTPPPGNGMTKRTGLAGNPAGACAKAGEASATAATENASVAKREIMPASGFSGTAYAPVPSRKHRPYILDLPVRAGQ